MSGNQVHLTNAEFAVLEALWDAGPQTIRALAERIYPNGGDSEYATVQKLLQRLESKGCVDRDRSEMAHIFHPTKERADLIDSQLQELAEQYERTPAQILIRWALQHDMVVLPKSSKPERIRENASVFDFTLKKKDMRRLDALDENLHTSWDPTDAP